jgi:hypothetical protein
MVSRALSDSDRARALARFRSLRHRGTRIGFEPLGPVVGTEGPEELTLATAKALAEIAATQRES